MTHFASDTERTARVQHRCYFCRGTIEPGTRYSDNRCVYDGRWGRTVAHLVCRDWWSSGVGEDLDWIWTGAERELCEEVWAAHKHTPPADFFDLERIGDPLQWRPKVEVEA